MMYEAQPDVSQYIDGLAVHWYADKFTGPNPLDEASAKFPGKFIMNTEACSGLKNILHFSELNFCILQKAIDHGTFTNRFWAFGDGAKIM